MVLHTTFGVEQFRNKVRFAGGWYPFASFSICDTPPVARISWFCISGFGSFSSSSRMSPSCASSSEWKWILDEHDNGCPLRYAYNKNRTLWSSQVNSAKSRQSKLLHLLQYLN
jgi:hypothetical protein